MSPRQEDAKTKHLSKVLAHVKNKAPKKDVNNLLQFVPQYFSTIAAEDFLERSPLDLYGAVKSHWDFAQIRNSGTPSIRIFNPSQRKHGWKSTHTIVEIVNDDMPFLVDSTNLAVKKNGFAIHLTVHPVIHVKRDDRGNLIELVKSDSQEKGVVRESLLHIEIDRDTEQKVLDDLGNELSKVLSDVRAAVTDWAATLDQALSIRDHLAKHPPPVEESEITEALNFIDWLIANHFTFLGYREYELITEKGEDVLRAVADTGLGILRGSGTAPSKSFLVLPKDIRKQARSKEILIITKANSVATVHRSSYLDYIGIKKFDAAGEVIGEQRFLGLFTSSAYSRSPRDIPLLRQKVAQVMLRSGLSQNSHGGKALLHILETFPRDELFQASVDELFYVAIGVQQLQERQRVKIFMRRDSFGRFFSCLIYVPRDRYTTLVRLQMQEILKAELNGLSVESTALISESTLARVHIIVRTTPWKFPKMNMRKLQAKIEAVVRSWQDELKDAAIARFGEERGLKMVRHFGKFFPPAFRDDVKPKAAAFDLEEMENLKDDDSLCMSLYRPTHNPQGLWRFKVFHREQPLPISNALPMLENMGVKVISERPYEVRLGDGSIIWIQDFELIHSGSEQVTPEDVKDIFQESFAHIWRGHVENDGFNRLSLTAQLPWRQIILLRACCKYLLQTGIPFSQAYMERTLGAHSEIARMLVHLFETKFDPLRGRDRKTLVGTLEKELSAKLDEVASLDEDRIMRGFMNVISATLRTNFYQLNKNRKIKSYVSFKFDPRKIPELPLPKPAYEIFVYSPRVEGVHLRGGKVARGGLRWSDRREDFRTEILGLMKAQQVKNTLIVPVGAKGGFVVKQPPESGDRETVLAEGIDCYKTFIRGLLDVTDNIVGGNIVHPKQVVRIDDDDTYLVVAADKGTATFSDIANEVSKEYNFWLGDAFASGGSVGYDHKKMGITARGAWESVKRHFRELGTDIQTTNFSLVGIGDMAGDVFGNGMLLSRHIKLKAAFNHLHIFLDPFPDPESSFQERKRLFKLPRSTWADYNLDLISKGGGVFSRSAKSIRISKEVQEALGIEAGALPPQELIKAILRAPVDLLWNGGIGTYVKATSESHADAGDRSNDSVRINAPELRCRVIGEGGNLGLTQLGRIEFALRGGRVNTDFIDNSAGVDCSDHEVNIKILLNLAAASGKKITEKQRNKLLADMTDEVAELVLRDNYMQTQALSTTVAQAPSRLNEHVYLIKALERVADLDRNLEFLPNDEELAERRAAGRGLSRPELSVLLSYTKIDIYFSLLDSDVPEDPYLGMELENYFPTPLRKRYSKLMPQHRLRREIIATAITNSLVNRMGPTFTHRMLEETGASTADISRAYTIAREVYDMRTVWNAIESLDNMIPASIQITMMFQIGRLLKHAAHWLLQQPDCSLNIADAVARFAPGMQTLINRLTDVLGPVEVEQFGETMQQYMDLGVPDLLAKRIAALYPLYSGMDIIDVAEDCKLPVEDVATVYYLLENRLEITWLRDEIIRLPVDGHWQAIARGSLRDNLYSIQRDLTALALAKHRKGSVVETVEQWLKDRDQRIQHCNRVLNDMRTSESLDFATASVAVQEIRKFN